MFLEMKTVIVRNVSQTTANIMSLPDNKPEPLKFVNREAVAKWLNDESGGTEYDDITIDIIINRSTEYDTSAHAILEKNGKFYSFEKEHFILQELIEPIQETGWFENYHECQDMEKEILGKRYDKHISLCL